MIKNKFGHIVSIASLASYGGTTYMAAYASSKSAASRLDHILRWELKKDCGPDGILSQQTVKYGSV